MEIRTVGDPVLRQVAAEIDDVDDRLVRLTEQMFVSMYEAPGIGLAAPQIGVEKRLFVYDLGDDPQILINPEIVETDGEWMYEEGCLSIPGLSFEILRPKIVHLRGRDLDGNEVEVEADELLARLFQHELDHLNGRLMLDLLDDDTRKSAMKELRNREMKLASQRPATPPASAGGGLQLP